MLILYLFDSHNVLLEITRLLIKKIINYKLITTLFTTNLLENL